MFHCNNYREKLKVSTFFRGVSSVQEALQHSLHFPAKTLALTLTKIFTLPSYIIKQRTEYLWYIVHTVQTFKGLLVWTLHC